MALATSHAFGQCSARFDFFLLLLFQIFLNMETGLRPRTSEHLDQILDPPLKLITNVSLAQFSCGRRDSTQMPLRTKNESFPLFSCDVQHQWQKCKIFRSIVLLQSPLKKTKKKKKKKEAERNPPPPHFPCFWLPTGSCARFDLKFPVFHI